MKAKMVSAVFALTMVFQSSAYAQADVLGALNLNQGLGGLLSALPVLGGGQIGLDALPLGIVTDAAAPLLAQSQNLAPVLELLPISQLVVPAAPLLGFVVTDLPVGTIAVQGVETGMALADVLIPGAAGLNTVWLSILDI